jgi:drug/metabolite transporter (DMT)-like permease
MDISLFGISLASAFLLSSANLVIKGNVSNNSLPNALLFRSLGMLPFTAFLLFLKEWKFWDSPETLGYIFLASIFGYAGIFFFFKASQVTSTPGLIAGLSSCTGLTVLLFGVFFGFSISFVSLPGIFLITIGLLVISLNLTDLKSSTLFAFSSGVPYMVLVIIFWGIAYNMIATISAKVNPALVFFVINIFEIGFSLCIIITLRTKILAPAVKSISPIFMYGLFLVLGFSGQMYAMSKANPGLVSSVISSSTIFSLLLANFFMNEKLSVQKYFGMSIVFCGLILINIIK